MWRDCLSAASFINLFLSPIKMAFFFSSRFFTSRKVHCLPHCPFLCEWLGKLSFYEARVPSSALRSFPNFNKLDSADLSSPEEVHVHCVSPPEEQARWGEGEGECGEGEEGGRQIRIKSKAAVERGDAISVPLNGFTKRGKPRRDGICATQFFKMYDMTQHSRKNISDLHISRTTYNN